MANLETAIAKLIRILGLDSVTADSTVERDARIALIDSMEDNKRYSFWFNQAKYSVVTQASRFDYPLPSDYMGMVGTPIINSTYDTSGTKRRLEYMPPNWCEENRWRGKETQMTLNTGAPECYSIDLIKNTILLIPVPSTDGEIVEFNYTKDCSIPWYKYTAASGWEFFRAGTNTALTDAFENEWLQYSPELIINRAGFKLLSGAYGGTNEAAKKAQDCMQAWMDLLNTKKGEQTKLASPKGITRYI
jgi:hypothetical protein